MDTSTIDIPTAVTAILTIIVAIGGVLANKFKGDIIGVLMDIADLLVEVGQLIITITKAGEDNQLSTEEWTAIKEQAREIQEDLLRLQGRVGSTGIFARIRA